MIMIASVKIKKEMNLKVFKVWSTIEKQYLFMAKLKY